jgi:hypothetical protein
MAFSRQHVKTIGPADPWDSQVMDNAKSGDALWDAYNAGQPHADRLARDEQADKAGVHSLDMDGQARMYESLGGAKSFRGGRTGGSPGSGLPGGSSSDHGDEAA